MITLLIFALTFSLTPAQNDVTAVKELERQRVEHLLAANWDQLENLLSPTLTYTHSNSVTETREEFMDAIQSGEMNYLSMEHTSIEGQSAGNVVILNAETEVFASLGDEQVMVSLKVTAVYSNHHGSWMLESWHSTRIP